MLARSCGHGCCFIGFQFQSQQQRRRQIHYQPPGRVAWRGRRGSEAMRNRSVAQARGKGKESERGPGGVPSIRSVSCALATATAPEQARSKTASAAAIARTLPAPVPISRPPPSVGTRGTGRSRRRWLRRMGATDRGSSRKLVGLIDAAMKAGTGTPGQ